METAIAQVNNFAELMESRGMQDSTPYQWGRALYKYTDCGPWTVFLTANGEFYYESDEANAEDTSNIIGIKIGSIVEGSDVEIDPVTLMFPFDPEEVDKVLEGINDEAKFYWERDNYQWLNIKSPRGTMYFCRGEWFEFKWEGKKPSKKVVDAILAMVKGEESIPYDTPTEIPGCKGWEITNWLNDCIY